MFYAFKYWGSEKTTCGRANPSTGRKSVAGELRVFSSKRKRDDLISREKGCWQAVAAKKARELHSGMTLTEFKKHAYTLMED